MVIGGVPGRKFRKTRGSRADKAFVLTVGNSFWLKKTGVRSLNTNFL